jgi:hypothetical protein
MNESKRNECPVHPLVRQFRLHWRSGKPQDITTRHPGSRMEAAAAAMNEAGIGAGALGALDYWEELPNTEMNGGR